MTQTISPKNHYQEWSLTVVKGGGPDVRYLEATVKLGNEKFTGIIGMITDARLYAENDPSRWLMLNKEDVERVECELQRLVRRLYGGKA